MSGAGMTGYRDWDSYLRRKPTPIEVARLARTHGKDVCCERWSHLHPKTIFNLRRQGELELQGERSHAA